MAANYFDKFDTAPDQPAQPTAANPIVGSIRGVAAGAPSVAAPTDPKANYFDQFDGPADSQYGRDKTEGKGDSFLAAGAGLYNQILGAHQGSGPAYKDMEGNLNYKRLGGLSDIGEGPVITGDDKSQIQFDPQKHVYFLDENGQPVAFERNDKMAEAPWTSAGRLLGFGAMAPSNIKIPSSLLGQGGETARTAADRVADFDASGIPPNLPAVTQGFASGLISKLMGTIPFVGTPIRKGMGATFKAADNSIEAIASRFGTADDALSGGEALQGGVRTNADAFGNTVDRIAGDYGAGSDAVSGGEALQKGAAAFKGERPKASNAVTTQMEDAQNLSIAKSTPTRDIGFQNKASTLFDAIPIASTKNVNLTNTADALNGITGKFPSNPALGSTLQSPGFARWYNLIKDNPNLTWQEVKDFRSFVGRNMRQPPEQLGVGPDDMRNLYGALSRDMEGAANEVGADAASAFSRANNYYRGGLDRLNNVLDVLDNADTPEKAFSWLSRAASENGRSADITRLEKVMRSLPAEAKGDAVSAVIRRLGQGAKTDGFSIGDFVNNFADISDRAKDVLFGAKGTSGRDSMEAFTRGVEPYAVNQSLLSGSPEKAFATLTRMAANKGAGADVGRLESIVGSLPEADKGNVAAAVIRKLGQPNAGQAGMEGAPGMADGKFSVSTFVTNYANISPQAKDALFGAADNVARKALDTFARSAGDLKSVESLANTSKTTQHGIAAGGIGATLAETAHVLLGGGVPTEAIAATLLGGIVGRGGAAVLMNPRMTRWLVGAPAAIQAEKWPGYLARLKTITDESPELRPIYEQLGGTEKGRSPMLPTFSGGSFLPPLASQRQQ